jgi:hypothetical protein
MRIAWISVAGLLLLGMLSTLQGVRNSLRADGSQDYQWTPSQMLLEGKNPYFLYREFLEGRLPTFPFYPAQVPNYPASSLMLLWPVTFMDLETSKMLWAGLNVAFAIGIVAVLGRLFNVSVLVCLLLLGLLMMGTPVRNTIGNGQHGLYSLFFFLLALLLQDKGAPRTASVCLALSWLKFTITWPLTILFLRPAYRPALLGAIAIHVFLTLFLGFWTGTSPLALLTGPLGVSETGTVIHMFDFIALFHYVGVSTRAPAFLLGAVLFGLAIVVIRKTQMHMLAQLAWLSLVCATWTHHSALDYFFLVVPLLYAITKGREGTIHATDRLQIGLTVCSVVIIWFGMRMLDAVQARLPTDPFVDLAQRATFWTAAVAIYALLACSAIELVTDRWGRSAPQSGG